MELEGEPGKGYEDELGADGVADGVAVEDESQTSCLLTYVLDRRSRTVK